MSQIVLNPGMKTVSLQEAREYHHGLDKTTALFQEISHLFRLPPGIYSCGDFKVSTVESLLLGGALQLTSLLKALKTPECQLQAQKAWQALFKKAPGTDEENQKTLQKFQEQIDQLKDQKESHEKFLNTLDRRFTDALYGEKDRVEGESFVKLLNDGALKLHEALSQLPPTSVSVNNSKGAVVGNNNTVHNLEGNNNNQTFVGANLSNANFQGAFIGGTTTNNSQNTYAPQMNMTNTGSGLQNTGQMHVGGNLTTGNTHQTTYNNSSGTKIGIQGNNAHIDNFTMN